MAPRFRGVLLRSASAWRLTTFAVFLEEDEDRAVFSCSVLEAAPALVKLQVEDLADASLRDAAVWHSISEALRHGALQNLLELEISLVGCFVGDGDFQIFTAALAGSACSKRLVRLFIFECKINAEGVCTLADHLGRDAFPKLADLRFGDDPGITDVGVMALAEAWLKPTQTSSTNLKLVNVGLGDVGMTALASVVSQGRFEQLEFLDFSRNGGITNQGIVALARAIETRGLPLLDDFVLYELDDDQVTLLGISAIAHAVIDGIPHLTQISVMNSGPGEDHHDMVLGMLETAGRRGKVNVM